MPWTGPVLPALPGISFPQKKTPTWSKVDAEALSGKRARTSLFTYPRYAYELPINYARNTQAFAEWQQLIGFFNSLAGGVGLFGYTDPEDNTIANQEFGVGDGITTGPFQLVREFGNFVEPVFLLNGAPVIEVAGSPTSAFTVDGYGRVTFNSAPANAAALTWSGSYYWPCQFDEDTIQGSKFVTNIYSIGALKFSTSKLV